MYNSFTSIEQALALFDAIHKPIIILSKHFVIAINQTSEKLFKANSHYLIGKTIFDFSPPKQGNQDSEQLAIDYINTAYAKNHVEFDWVHLDFEGKHLMTHINLTKFNIGTNAYLIGIVDDYHYID